MADFTGFNPTQAKTDLEALSHDLRLVKGKLWSAFDYIVGQTKDGLSDVWASPNAKEFGATYIPQIADLINGYLKDIHAILSSTARAVDIVGSSNGYVINLSGDYSAPALEEYYPQTFKEEKDGIVGMNVAVAKIAVSSFNEEIKDTLNTLDGIDLHTIALYDPEGSMQEAFKTVLTTLKTNIEELVSSINSAITSAYETEENNIRVAKDSAASTMSA